MTKSQLKRLNISLLKKIESMWRLLEALSCMNMKSGLSGLKIIKILNVSDYDWSVGF